MRAWLILTVLLVLVPLAAAQQEAADLFASDTLGIAVRVSSDLTLQPKKQGAMSADYVQADLFFYPKETSSQHVLALETSPEAERRGNLLRFGVDSLAGHHMFDSVNRAECPGRFWRDEYRARLYADLTGGTPMPTDDDQIKALVALAHFIRNGWNPADLSDGDKAAIKAAAERIPA